MLFKEPQQVQRRYQAKAGLVQAEAIRFGFGSQNFQLVEERAARDLQGLSFPRILKSIIFL
jgi:hypothetical protein